MNEAIATYKEAIRVQPSYADAHNSLGLALYAQGKRDEAIAAYKEAIRLEPDLADGYNNLGNALSDEGKRDEAIAAYREAIRLKRDFAFPHYNLGNALHRQGKRDEAIAAYKEAIRVQPSYADAHNNLGKVLSDQRKFDEAIAELREAIRLKPDMVNAHCNLAFALKAQGKLEEAIVEYKQAIRLEPDNAGAQNNLAWALVLSPKRPRRDYDEGLLHARKAVTLAPKDGNSFGTLAVAEYRSGNWTQSLAACEQSMALSNGGTAYDWFFQALVRGQKGDEDQARKWFDQAVAWTKAKDPKNQELLQFWTEAAVLLGQPGPDASGPGSPAAPAPENPR